MYPDDKNGQNILKLLRSIVSKFDKELAEKDSDTFLYHLGIYGVKRTIAGIIGFPREKLYSFIDTFLHNLWTDKIRNYMERHTDMNWYDLSYEDRIEIERVLHIKKRNLLFLVQNILKDDSKSMQSRSSLQSMEDIEPIEPRSKSLSTLSALTPHLKDKRPPIEKLEIFEDKFREFCLQNNNINIEEKTLTPLNIKNIFEYMEEKFIAELLEYRSKNIFLSNKIDLYKIFPLFKEVYNIQFLLFYRFYKILKYNELQQGMGYYLTVRNKGIFTLKESLMLKNILSIPLSFLRKYYNENQIEHDIIPSEKYTELVEPCKNIIIDKSDIIESKIPALNKTIETYENIKKHKENLINISGKNDIKLEIQSLVVTLEDNPKLADMKKYEYIRLNHTHLSRKYLEHYLPIILAYLKCRNEIDEFHQGLSLENLEPPKREDQLKEYYVKKKGEYPICASCGVKMIFKTDRCKDIFIKDIYPGGITRVDAYYPAYKHRQIFSEPGKDGNIKVRICNQCNGKDGVIPFDIEEPTHLGFVPDEIKAIGNDVYLRSKVALGKTLCSIVKEPVKHYYFQGNFNHYSNQGMFGYFKYSRRRQEEGGSDARMTPHKENKILNFIKFVKNCNHLYKKLLPNYIIDKMYPKEPDRSIIPLLDETFVTIKIKGSREAMEDQMIVPRDPIEPEENHPPCPHIQIGEEYVYEAQEGVPEGLEINLPPKRNALYYGDDHLLEKLFPNLFWEGKGGYNSTYFPIISLKKYAKMKLLSCVPEPSHDIYFIYFLYDRLMKERIYTFNKGVHLASDSGLRKNLLVEDLTTEDQYKYLGTEVSYKMPGTTKHHHMQFNKLLEIMNNEDKMNGKTHPDLFITITLNEGDKNLHKSFDSNRLQGKRKGLSNHEPIKTCNYYFKKQIIIDRAILGTKTTPGIFGKVTSYFSKIEYQMRGSPHSHILLYLDKESSDRLDDGYLVSATIPDPNIDQDLYDKVRKFQIHKHNKNCKLTPNSDICKNGYPQPIRDHDQVDESTGRWIYKRRYEGERNVVPYNDLLLKLCNCNINVQRLTDKALLYYICAYITKIQPGFNLGLADKTHNQIKNLLLVRNISVVEAIALTFGYRHYKSKPAVTFLYLALPENRVKLLKSKEELDRLTLLKEELAKAGKSLSDKKLSPYMDGPIEHYLNRPKEIEDITLIDFVKKWKYSKNFDRVPIRSKDPDNPTWILCHSIYYYPRSTHILLSYTKPTPVDGELFYYIKLVETTPYRDDSSRTPLISKDNVDKSYFVECILRNLLMGDSGTEEEFLETITNLWSNMKITKTRLKKVMLDRLQACPTDDLAGAEWLKKHINHLEVMEEDMPEDMQENINDSIRNNPNIKSVGKL